MTKLLRTGFALATLAALAFAAPVTARAQAAAKTVTCKDKTTSKGGQGACSGHGGIEATAAAATKTPPTATVAKSGGSPTKTKAPPMKKAAPTPPPPAAKTTTPPPAKVATATKTESKGAATAKCKDGTMSYAKNHTGACSSHGGVDAWLDGTKKTP